MISFLIVLKAARKDLLQNLYGPRRLWLGIENNALFTSSMAKDLIKVIFCSIVYKKPNASIFESMHFVQSLGMCINLLRNPIKWTVTCV